MKAWAGGAAAHAAALVRPAMIVAAEVDLENRLHLVDAPASLKAGSYGVVGMSARKIAG
jgi:hypothetical protein